MVKAPAKRPAKAAARKAKAVKAAKPMKKAVPRKSAAKRTVATKRTPPNAPLADIAWVEAPDLAPETQAPQAPLPRPVPLAPPTFDTATGEWIAAPAPAPAALGKQDDRPEASAKGSGRYVGWTVLLAIDLFAVTFLVLSNLVAGIILFAAPHSATAQQLRDQLGKASTAALVAETLLSFVMFGVIPFLWVLGTRRVPVEGTRRYLQLKEPGKAILRGVLLVIPLLVGVAIVSGIYTLATEGIDGLTHPSAHQDKNPAVDAILAQLTWPLAVMIALGAGVGEEVLFRGVLTRPLGWWGQAIVFGLAHATGGYLPQVVFAFGFGLLFGWLFKRGWSLYTLMTAHFLYDFTLLAISLLTR